MDFKHLPASVLLFIGGALTTFITLPLVCDFFPIVLLGDGSGHITFLGTRDLSRVTFTQINGWTLIGFAGYEVMAAFLLFGVAAVVLAVNYYMKLVPIDKYKIMGVSLTPLFSILVGIVDVVFIALIYIGNTGNFNSWGLSSLGNYTLHDVSVSASLGIGFYILVLSALLMLVGAILTFVFKPSTEGKLNIA